MRSTSKALLTLIVVLWAAVASAQPTVRFEVEGESAVSDTLINVTGMSTGDAIIVSVAGLGSSSRDYVVTTDCAADATEWANTSFGGTPGYAKENGAPSADHVMILRILDVGCSGTIQLTIDESGTHYGYSYSVIAFDCQPTCTDDDSDVFDNAAGGSNTRYSAPSGEINVTAQAVVVAACSTAGTTAGLTVPTSFTDFTGTAATRNMQAYRLTTGAVSAMRGDWTETNQRDNQCLIFAVADGAGAATGRTGNLMMGNFGR